MEIPVLNANYRIGVGKNSARRSRNIGQIPGVVYDSDLNKLIGIDKKDLDSVLAHYGENALVNIQLGGDTIKSMIVEVQHHPVSRQVMHVDFKPVRDDTRVRAHIPIKFIGMAEVERSGGILQRQRQEIEVECAADRVPKFINIDLSRLAVGQSFKVLDIEIAEELSILTKPTEVIATLTAANNFVEPGNSVVANKAEEKEE
ncbi:MAG: large subunit ribosomal protein [Petroclostridium sp.]|jgi:large subunit ribosomal protein L25|uniref:50S ribosomal protein L25 n=1 Tax=Petroclostridium xylanilyticum TaxID=1792311 RepID=UPI000B998FE6|nr:50S ribosomal protein L25 [Petroclostridium xylanilyticum]MBZ4644848.1 ribosomal protein [Clostridia bacterium]MDK2809571.1 large subunit ribosomal protein [Petroclostridium sp.]